ncbi:MAG: CoB--CoM heterodisulfide reductase iron-sulfur subunit A family protein [Methanomassiliicoccales archaeon]|jgi:heterodisulfide reductase subunit A|nr:CoB--CoM heterodisulfide reductase iron-sulfur subunit A family protein [Methanomassiliicoccales archaeon]
MPEEIVGAALVIGGGIGGVQAALDLADSGFKVYLVDSSPSIGGTMAQLDKTFPTNDCSMCIMAPKLVSAGRHRNIEIISNAEITKVEGRAGHFKVTVTKHYPYIDPQKCTGCGICAEHCPIEGPNWFDENLAPRKAIYVPFPQAVPLVYTIEKGMCIGCGECQKVCSAQAIEFKPYDEESRVIDVGAIVLSMGFDKFKAFKKREYGYGIFPNVITNSEFERMLSASGPTGGHIIRPSDGDIPKRIAFIQCVGSRDAQLGHGYCSSICCMAALKEAIIAQEHEPDIRCHIFFMDVRAFGKEFEEYRIRAEEEYGIKISRNTRVAGIEEDHATGNLIIRYYRETEDLKDELVEETFDLVVLSVGMIPSDDAHRLCKKLGIKLNEFGYCWTSDFSPLETNVPGIFVCGTFSSPKDIPDTVAQGSGVAAKVGSLLSTARGTLVSVGEYPEEIDVTGQEPRIGVFVCHCGINIGGIIDVPAVTAYARTLPGVVYAEDNLYTCSSDTQERIKEKIKEYKLNRVVVASCTPRTHEPLFRNTLREAGLNPYLFEMANIRDQCSWVHMKEKEKATKKAKDLVRMSVMRAALLSPLPTQKVPVKKAALVIGGGLAGMTAALEIAAQGYPVHIVEKEKELGGNLRRIRYLITGSDPREILNEIIKKVSENPLIKTHLATTVEDISGYVGNFTTTLSSGEKIEHGVIIVATGGVEYRPEEYLYGVSSRVVTQTQFGKMLEEDNLSAKTVAIIQCVGSRNREFPNCSRICCFTSIANAIELKRRHPETTVYILYKDIRTYGFKEAYYTEAARLGVVFLRYGEDDPPVLKETNGQLELTVKDQFLMEDFVIHPDLVVLNAAVRPNPDNERLAKMLKVPLTKDGYFLEAHMKLRPVDFATEGVFLAGLAHWPKLIEESISQACGAAARAITVLSKDELEAEAVVSCVDEAKCRGCGRCEEVCEFSAATVREVAPGVLKAYINPALCKGCGACAVACCTGAITTKHFTDEQILTMVEAALREGVV